MKNSILFLLTYSLLTSSLWAQSLDSSFAHTTNLTDKEAKDAKEFIHKSRKDEIIQKACEKNNLGSCSESEASDRANLFKGSFGQAVENNLGKLYGLLFGATGFMSGQGPSVKVLSKKGEKETETQADYCIYGAMGHEVLSTFIQKAMQDKIEKNLQDEKDLQLKSLLALKQNHLARHKTSLIQASIYTATGACYITRAAASGGKVVMDWQYWAKMSASLGLSAIYFIKAKKHKMVSYAVQKVIDQLPKAGDCNPWTRTSCFCAETTSRTTYADLYENICVLNQGNSDLPRVSVGCGVLVDDKMTYDQACKCKETGTCFRTRLAPMNLNFKVGHNLMTQANKGFDLLASGEFDEGKFDSYSLQTGTYASKIKDKIIPTSVPQVTLNQEEQKLANAFSGLLPPKVAALVAKSSDLTPPSHTGDKGLKDALSNLPEGLKEKVKEIEPVKYSSGGEGFNINESMPEQNIEFPQLSDSSQQKGTEILSFAEKAMNRADVTHNQDTPLFDIISNRYMRSGLNKLQIEESK